MRMTIDGLPTYLYTAGKPILPDLPAVVFLHGAANDHSVWALQSRWLAHHGFNAIVPDLPGHGRSDGKAIASIEGLADWTITLLDTLALPEIHLVGHSMGSLVALETASRRPAGLASLSLLGCAVPMAVSDALLTAALNDETGAISLITGWSHAPGNLLGGGPIPGCWLPGMNRALMSRADSGVLHRDLLNCREYTAGFAAATRVACPSLLVVGERDLMTPRKAMQELKAKLPQVQEVVIAGAGHAMMSERPDAILDSLHRHLLTRHHHHGQTETLS